MNAIPFEGDAITVRTSAEGAEVGVISQKLEGRLTPGGLWLTSTEETPGENRPFRVMAVAMGRGGGEEVSLAESGVVELAGEVARLIRPGLVEEYRVSVDGVRQDFVVEARAPGAGALRLRLALDGVGVADSATGVTLTLAGSGREISYNRLCVTDATGRELPAHFETGRADVLAIVVDDGNAVYPVRIDPTFSDANWGSVGGGPGANNTVAAFVVDAAGNLFAGGGFTEIGGVSASRIAKWDGSNWSALGSGVDSAVRAMAVSGTDLYAVGLFTTAGGVTVNGIAKWDGAVWTALGTGMNGPVNALAVSGPDVYAGGLFTDAGGVTVSNIAKWDGNSWSSPGTGTAGQVDVLAMSGTDLYAGGAFATAGGVAANRIAKWDGGNWSALGSGTDARIYALAVSGSDLYAGGSFITAGGVTVNRIAKWDGSAWSALGSGMNSLVTALTVSGPDLYAGGYFITADGVTVNHIAKWSGGGWSALGSGTDSFVAALAASGTDLYVGGGFSTAGGIDTSRPFIAHADLAASPEIVVEQPAGQVLVDGATVVDFGNGVADGGCAGLVFTVRNTGDGDLTGLGITIDGADAGDFSVVSGPTAPVAPAGITMFTVRFGPAATGSRNAVIHIASNDADESPFDIVVTGTGVTARSLFDAVAAAAGLVGADAEPEAIPFNDGIPNLVKYAFNLDMALSGRRVMTPGGLSGSPVYSREEVGGQDVWRVEFLRRKGCRVEYHPMRSTTLDPPSFVPMTGPVTVTDIDGQWERVVVHEPLDPERCFGRFEITLP